jgi:hypothetical protein
MIDSTNNSFEEQWQRAFDDTQLTPPESVWEKIELSLKPQNMPPSKPDFGNKPYYFLGGIVVLVLGIFVWFNQDEKVVGEDINHGVKEVQTVEKQVITKKIEPVFLVKEDKKIIKKKTNQNIIKEVVGLSVPMNTKHGAEDINPETETKVIEEIPSRTLTDSIATIEPLSIKNIHSQIENPTINLPIDQTPYYVKPIPKPQKKSILKNVKISVGAGVYQQ